MPRPTDRKAGTVADPAHLADRAAIHDLIAAYSLAYDCGDYATLGDLFTEDARYAFTPAPDSFPPYVAGRENIVAAMSALRGHHLETRKAHQRHFTTNTFIIRLGKDTAEVRSLMCVGFALVDGGQEFSRSGVYADVLAKEGDRWRIADRHLWLRELPPLYGVLDTDRQPAPDPTTPGRPM
ncbi:nuclear transport factor 2 family protein [Streptomyces palmae]|uniref:Nuclear transport factor 2 family protein n=1 Tax=Streptomyces palmae TaxID=1701085 RepID=A0A4Z0HA31_9ACTN|nr:nuclear transport factor 2 family protein [Streptomyces palmae]TGB14858.1 nuclear transport factor 2 family protein [Streptomyces palmae]